MTLRPNWNVDPDNLETKPLCEHCEKMVPLVPAHPAVRAQFGRYVHAYLNANAPCERERRKA